MNEHPLDERSLSERGRVEALLADGKISEEEASLLLEALDEVDAAEAAAAEADANADAAKADAAEADAAEADAEGDAAGSHEGGQAESLGEPPAPPAPPEPPRAAEARARPGAAEPHEASGSAAGGERRWLRLTAMARNVELRSEAGLAEPRVKGANLERAGQDWVVQAQGIESLLNRRGNLEIAVPPGCGVDLAAKAGNVEVAGVAFVRGHVVAGNLNLKDIEGIDLEIKAGNLDASLRLLEGEHRVQVTMGNADIRLLKGSSVKLNCDVSMGALDIDGPTKLGEGDARLDLSVRMGNLNVKVPRG